MSDVDPTPRSFFRLVFRTSALPSWRSKPTTDLLAVPYAFTQSGILSPRQLINEAKSRGFDVTTEQLAVLSELDLLAPMFEFVDYPDPLIDVHASAAFGEWPFEQLAHQKRLRDAVQRGFVLSEADSYRYSTWQLLWFHAVGWDQLAPSSPEDFRVAFGETDVFADHLARHSEAQRGLAIALEVLSTSFLPFVRGVVRGGRSGVAWSPAAALGAEAILNWLGVQQEQLFAQAESLLVAAHSIDPLGRWAPLTGHCSLRARDQLRGFARVAVDLREAAELLLRAYDELPGSKRSTEVPSRIGGFWQPLHERLERPIEERDRILNDLGLSPFPSLIVAVEGQTEELVLSKALEVFGLRVGMQDVELARLRGVGNDVGVLARYAGAPRLAEEVDEAVLLRRPLPHIAVIADPEGRYATPQGREAVKAQLVEDLVLSIPERFRTDVLRNDLSTLVTVDTWGGHGGPFEFAHFTDDELATALADLRPELDHAKLVAAFAGQRRNPAPDVQKVLDSALLRAIRSPSKVEYALELWRRLEPLVEAAAFDDKTSPIPISRICRQLVEYRRRVAVVKALRF